MEVGFSNGDIAIAVCDRCKFKRKYIDLVPDGAVPSLRVCKDRCYDEPNPFLSWNPQVPSYVLQFPRPDQQLTTTYQYVLPNSPVLAAQDRSYYRAVIKAESGDEIQTQGNPPRDAWINGYIPPSLLKTPNV